MTKEDLGELIDLPLEIRSNLIDHVFLANATLVTITNNIGLIARMCALNEKIDKVSLELAGRQQLNEFFNFVFRSSLSATFCASIPSQ